MINHYKINNKYNKNISLITAKIFEKYNNKIFI